LTETQVLPLAEESADETKDELFDMADVRVEVMRARGAGGQVRVVLFLSTPTPPHPRSFAST
jgi:protein subunit release factor A